MTLQEAMAQQPQWVVWWTNWLLFGAFILPLALLIWKESRVAGMLTALASVAAGMGITWLYGGLGYVKLLGLPHIILWGPLAFYLLGQARRPDMPRAPMGIIMVILAMITLSLAFDITDVVRYVLGERTPTILPEG